MPHEKVKVYFDGSHYIAIPQNEGKNPGKGGYHGNENDEIRTAFEKAYKGTKAKKDDAVRPSLCSEGEIGRLHLKA